MWKFPGGISEFAEDIGELVASRYTLATFVACSVKFTQFVMKAQKPVNYTSNRTITVNDVTLVHSSDVFFQEQTTTGHMLW